MFISSYAFTYPWSSPFSNYCQRLWAAVGLDYIEKLVLHVKCENTVATLWGDHSLDLNFDYLNDTIYGILCLWNRSTERYLLSPSLTHYLKLFQCCLISVCYQEILKFVLKMGMSWFEGSLEDVEIDCSILCAIFEIAESKIYEK